MRARLNEARLAVMLLTRLPVGTLSDPAPGIAQAAWAFPLVGVVVGVLTWGAFTIASVLGLPAHLAATLALLALLLATGAMHFDGLADFADGMGGGRDRDHVLEIMRDSRLGTYGALALAIAALLWVLSVGAIGDTVGLLHFILIAAVSRAAMLALAILMPPARKDGLGASAHGAGGYVSIIATGLCALLFLGFVGLGLLVAAAALAATTAAIARRRIGGQTGDVLGASQLLAELGGWLYLAAILT